MTKIQWTERTWNPITGCTVCSPGCQHCYAMRMAWRLSQIPSTAEKYAGTVERTKGGQLLWTGKLQFSDAALLEPLRRKTPTTYFVNSMSDLFHEDMPDHWIDRVFAVMALCPQHTFQVLTKRAERMREYVIDWHNRRRKCEVGGFGLPGPTDDLLMLADLSDAKAHIENMASGYGNIWLGVSVEDQAHADQRVPHLLATPAAVRFLSCEPLLGPVDLTFVKRFPTIANEYLDALRGTCHTDQSRLPNPDPSWSWPGREFVDGARGLDWIIAGGESGPGSRPMHPDWLRSLRDQCQAAGVPFFFKQWGDWGPDNGPDADFDRDGFRRDRVMEGAGPCQVLVDNRWQEYPDGYAVPLELCSGHGEFVYRLGKKQTGRLLDGREWNEMPAARSA